MEWDHNGAAAGEAWCGHWSAAHAKAVTKPGHIVWAEMFGALYAVETVAKTHSDTAVRLILDSGTNVSIINAWATRSKAVSALLRRMAQVATRHNLAVTAVHRRGEDNHWADTLSRCEKHRFRPLQSLRTDDSCVPVSCASMVRRVRIVFSSELQGQA